MIRKILTVPNEILVTRCEGGKTDRDTRKALIDTLTPLENAVGLAAPQIGVLARAFALKDLNGEVKVYTNPVIVSAGIVVQEDIEGCLSIPNEYYRVQRARDIRMKHDKGELTATGDLARQIQHEIDHLNGVLISQIGERVIPFEHRNSGD